MVKKPFCSKEQVADLFGRSNLLTVIKTKLVDIEFSATSANTSTLDLSYLGVAELF